MDIFDLNSQSFLVSLTWLNLKKITLFLLCVSLGWVGARVLARGIMSGLRRRSEVHSKKITDSHIRRIFTPLFTLIFIVIAQPFLGKTWAVVSELLFALLTINGLIFSGLHIFFIRSRKNHSKILLLLCEKIAILIIWIGTFFYITGVWPELLKYLEVTQLPIGRYEIPLLSIVQAAFSVMVTLVLALWASTALEQRVMQLHTLHSSLRVVMARMGRALFILIALLVSLSLVGIDLTVLSVFGGALGVGLGLGLQKIVSSYVSGFVILLERSLAIGDMVSVDKYYGQVSQINARYTVLRGLDGIESVVPNEMLVGGAVQNYSLSDHLLRLSSRLTVSYDTNIEQVLKLLEESAASVERVAIEPPPQAFLVGFGDYGLQLETGFWIADPENGRTRVLSDVNRAIWHMLQKYQIQLPYPKSEMDVMMKPPVTSAAFPAA